MIIINLIIIAVFIILGIILHYYCKLNLIYDFSKEDYLLYNGLDNFKVKANLKQ